ncbi:MAG: hypothetical protein KJ067_13975 [Vicinamibacteria bacterium]|jgi:hypothetical protein|nr:hypothetical protein [Vicinamibacteria bacterium]
MQFALFVLTAWMWVGGTFDAMVSDWYGGHSIRPSEVVLADGPSSVPPPPPGP